MKPTRFEQSHCNAIPSRSSRSAKLLALAIGSLMLTLAGTAQGTGLRPEVMSTLRKATFEVVVEKPTADSLTYEKPLPLDLIPYQQRMDKYHSIGTAFAMEGGLLVSAAHVFDLGSSAVRDRLFLRNSDGRIIPLDKVLRYSLRRDFIVFSVKDLRLESMLKANKKAAKNQQVFAVGNALGEGVIARDGLYTSDTPEADEGHWQWMRFSAAASPGNSGGPLVDFDGHVLGVVIGKSENENLNYALPISEVDGASNSKAEVYRKMMFRLDITDETLLKNQNDTLDLPAPYLDFGRALQASLERFNAALSDEFLAQYRHNMFPNAASAQALLYGTQSANFPRMIAKQKDGTWAAFEPGEKSNADLGNNGYVSFGSMGSFVYLRLQAPDTVSATQLRSDSKLFMDLLLKALGYTRPIGKEQVRILSLGTAKEEETIADTYHRRWQVRRWLLEFSEQRIVTYALPVPGGYAVMLSVASTSASPALETDLKTLTDFVYVSYYGTLRQWADFMASKDLLPTAFDDIHLDMSYGKELRYASRRVSFSYPSDLMTIDENSDLELQFSYFKEADRVVWDVTKVVAGENKNSRVYIAVTRHAKPPQTFSDADKRDWDLLVNGRVPYSGEAFFDKSQTLIGAAHGGTNKPSVLAAQPVVYSVLYAADGAQKAKFMSGKLAAIRSGLLVSETVGRLMDPTSNATSQPVNVARDPLAQLPDTLHSSAGSSLAVDR